MRTPNQLSRTSLQRDGSLTGRFASESNNNGNEGDADLAKQFSEELKRRSVAETESPETYTLSSNEPSPAKPIRKFTGASSPLFTKSNTNNAQSNNVQREREREFNLASRFERTFPIQAAIILASAIFFLSVGLSGGITDGSDRNFGDDDLIEDAVVEQLERIRTDDAAQVRGSYWL
jgi:hypothetical protein